MICLDHVEAHNGLDVQLSVVGIHPRWHENLCAGCRAGLSAMGIIVRVERRSDPERADRGSFRLGPLFRRIGERVA